MSDADPYVLVDEDGRRWSVCPFCYFGAEHMQHHGAPPWPALVAARQDQP